MDDPASSFLALLAGDVAGQGSITLIMVVAKLAAVLFFVGANAFFVGSEFALVSVRRTRLEARAAAGSRRARAALRLIGDPTSFISATQLGITIASLALGWIGEPTVAFRRDTASPLRNTHSNWSGSSEFVAILKSISILTSRPYGLGI